MTILPKMMVAGSALLAIAGAANAAVATGMALEDGGFQSFTWVWAIAGLLLMVAALGFGRSLMTRQNRNGAAAAAARTRALSRIGPPPASLRSNLSLAA